MDRRQKLTNRDWRILLWIYILIASLSCSALAPGMLAGQSQKPAQQPGQQPNQQNDQQYQTLIRSTRGADLFRAYCASCHGRDAKGHGPAAPALKATVPDLTVLAKNNGGRSCPPHHFGRSCDRFPRFSRDAGVGTDLSPNRIRYRPRQRAHG
jgi:hypothetical protein